MLKSQEIKEFHPQARLYLVTYLSQGYRVKGYLAVPRGDGPFPLLIYCRGGIRQIGMTKLEWVREFVEQGFTIFAPFYRGNRGGEGWEDFAGEDRYDVIDAIPWLAAHPAVDLGRIHLFGFSRGSLMALFAAMACPVLVKSVTVWGGISDLSLTYTERIDLRRMLKRVIGGPPWKMPQAYQDRSPIYRVDDLKCPVCIIHGTADRQVSVEHAYRLINALKQSQVPHKPMIYPGLGHHFPSDIRKVAMQRMFDWIRNNTAPDA